MNAPAAPREPVGMIGLGVMGAILARRLLAAGWPVVVYNRTARKSEALERAGARVATTPAALAGECRHVFLALSGEDALNAVLDGAGGLCTAGGVATEIVCDLGTDDPRALRAAGARLGRAGITLTEAPMAGSVHDATHGTLQLMLGGDAEALHALAPYFACWGPPPVHFGPLGNAAAAKIALNLLLGLMTVGLADAIALLRRASVSEASFMAVLASSGLRSPVYQRLWERHSGGDRAVRFSVANLRKDALLALAHPAWEGKAPPMVAALAGRLRAVSAAHLGNDYSGLLDAAAFDAPRDVTSSFRAARSPVPP